MGSFLLLVTASVIVVAGEHDRPRVGAPLDLLADAGGHGKAALGVDRHKRAAAEEMFQHRVQFQVRPLTQTFPVRGAQYRTPRVASRLEQETSLITRRG